eukprot:2517221-Pyramimonas_sp.AAC.1
MARGIAERMRNRTKHPRPKGAPSESFRTVLPREHSWCSGVTRTEKRSASDTRSAGAQEDTMGRDCGCRRRAGKSASYV